MRKFEELSDEEQKNFYDLGAKIHGAAWWQSGGRIKREIATMLYLESIKAKAS